MLIDIDEATSRLFELVDLAHQGQVFVITKGGVPMARLEPPDLTPKPPAQVTDTKPTPPTQP